MCIRDSGVTLAVCPTHTEDAPPKTGLVGTALMMTFVEAGDVQLFEFLTVKVYVALAGRAVMVKLVPEPV